MTRIANLHASMEAYHQQRVKQEREFQWWIIGFCLIQTARLAFWVLLAAFAYAFISSNWAIFSFANALGAMVVLAPLGGFVAWRKIQSA